MILPVNDKRISLKDWIEWFDAGYFDSPDRRTMVQAGWYDWFCRDTSLKNKLKKLAPKVKAISRSHKIDIRQTYVFFKNNCPLRGPLYDQFSICEIESGDVLYCIIPKSGHAPFYAEVWGYENEFKEPLVSSPNWIDILEFFYKVD